VKILTTIIDLYWQEVVRLTNQEKETQREILQVKADIAELDIEMALFQKQNPDLFEK
jgi:hypothetical protein